MQGNQENNRKPPIWRLFRFQNYEYLNSDDIEHNVSLRVPLRRAVRGFPAEATKPHIFSSENAPESRWCVLRA